MKAVQKVFNFFSGSQKIQSFSQMKEQKISGELYKKSIGSNLVLLSNDILMSFNQVDSSVMEYNLEVLNICPRTDSKSSILTTGNWKNMKFPISCDMNLKFCVDKNMQDCLIWEHNREFYIYSNETETNNFQNFKQFLENLCILIYSNAYEMKIETVEVKKSQEFLMILGELENINQFIEDHYKNLYTEEDYQPYNKNNSQKENESILNVSNSSQKVISYVNFKNTYPKAKLLFQAKVF